MIRQFFKKRSSRTFSIPPGERVYAIGDVHGRLDLLELLLARIEEDERRLPPAATTFVFLGDLIDRGADSCAVIDCVMALAASHRVRVLTGNHEEMFLRVLAGDEAMLRGFLRVGGKETVFSYGLSLAEYRALDREGLLHAIAERVPPEHRAFLASFEDMIEIGDYLFVHAGIRPGIALADQQTADLRWIREPFLRDRSDHGRMVVHGHTITEEPVLRPNRIGIDTGAYASGRLTALGLDGHRHWLLDTREG